jgi:hypothetical protein
LAISDVGFQGGTEKTDYFYNAFILFVFCLLCKDAHWY